MAHKGIKPYTPKRGPGLPDSPLDEASRKALEGQRGPAQSDLAQGGFRRGDIDPGTLAGLDDVALLREKRLFPPTEETPGRFHVVEKDDGRVFVYLKVNRGGTSGRTYQVCWEVSEPTVVTKIPSDDDGDSYIAYPRDDELDIVFPGGTWTITDSALDMPAGAEILSAGASQRVSLLVSAGSMFPSTTAGSGIPAKTEFGGDTDVFIATFAPGVTSYIQFAIPAPDGYDGGTMTARFFCAETTGTTGQTFVWNIEAKGLPDAGDLASAWGTAVSATDTTQGSASGLLISPETSEFTPSGTPAGGNLLMFRASRTAGGTLIAPLGLAYILIEASRDEFTD